MGVVIDKKFWQEIVYTDGKLDEKKVMDELHDYAIVLHNVPKVYTAITGGQLSKPLYEATTILSIHDELCFDKDITQDDVSDMIKRAENLQELKEELVDYFELDEKLL